MAKNTKKTNGKAKKANYVRESEYKGNRLVQFGEEGGRYNLQFGKGKARQVCEAMNEDGLAVVLGKLFEIADVEPTKAIQKVM